MQSTETNKAAFRRLVEEGPNRGNLDVVTEVLTEDVVFHPAGESDPVTGRDGVRALIQGARTAFPDLRADIDQLVGEGDRVIGVVTLRGTNTGDAMGQPATGRSATFTVVHMLRFVDGRIAEDRQVMDRLSLMEQLQPSPQPA